MSSDSFSGRVLEIKPSAKRSAEKGSGKKRRASVLIVDDDPSARRLLVKMFTELGCSISMAVNGQEAAKVAPLKNYDLIVLDWHMPDLCGGQAIVEAQEKIYQNVGSGEMVHRRKIPVVTYTSRDLADLTIPVVNSFDFIDHWRKQTRYPNLLEKARAVLKQMQLAA